MKAYFNPTVLRKNITRFAPLWGLYTAFMLLTILLVWSGDSNSAHLMNNSETLLAMMGIVNFIYAGLCALLLFSDLFTPRLCNMLHAFPLRREGWFLTHTVSAILFCIVPNLLGAAIAAALLGPYAYGALLWLGLTVMEFLFFFGLGAFCSLCAGAKLGAVSIYAIINFLSPLVTFLLTTLYEPMLYGVSIDGYTISQKGSPVVNFASREYLVTEFDNMTGITTVTQFPWGDWIYAGASALIGVALLGLALVLYRRRKLEGAGDMIVWKPVAPVILTIYTLLLGTLLYFIAEDVVGNLGYVFLAAGLAIGYFTGRMMLEKRVHVFRKRNFLAFGILVVVFAASLGITRLDILGITRYVPDPQEVESISVSPYESAYSIREQSCLLTDPEDLAAIEQLHRDAVNNRAGATEASSSLHLRYTLKNGKTVDRTYYLPLSLGYEPLLQGYYSRPLCVLGTEDLNVLMEHAVYMEFYPYNDGQSLPYVTVSRNPIDSYPDKYEGMSYLEEQISGAMTGSATAMSVMKAVYADCLAGTMSQFQWHADKTPVGMLQLQVAYGQYNEYIDITVYEDCENTVTALYLLPAHVQ